MQVNNVKTFLANDNVVDAHRSHPRRGLIVMYTEEPALFATVVKSARRHEAVHFNNVYSAT